MSVEITACFDFVCPFCYLSSYALKQAAKNHDVVIHYHPFELRRAPTPKVDPMHDEARLKRFDEVLLPTAKKLGVEMKLPWISPHPYTTVPLQGFHYVREEHADKLPLYIETVFHAFYVEEKDIGEQKNIEDILKQIGIPVEPFQQVVAQGKYVKLLEEEKADAKERLGVSGIPTYFIGGQKLVGCQDPREIEMAILRAEMDQESSEDMIGMACGADGCGPAH
jgi:predicted DsbA family dithiol-disulfide isomerase